MKNKLIKLIGTMMVAGMVISTPLSASASMNGFESVTETYEIQPRAAVCVRCGGRISTSTSWGTWLSKRNVKCTHGYAWGTDLIEERTGVRTRRCLSCGDGRSYNVTQTKTECHGYNK